MKDVDGPRRQISVSLPEILVKYLGHVLQRGNAQTTPFWFTFEPILEVLHAKLKPNLKPARTILITIEAYTPHKGELPCNPGICKDRFHC